MIENLTDAALAPLYEPLGWQGFAYGLLGLRTIKRVIDWGRGLVGGMSGEK